MSKVTAIQRGKGQGKQVKVLLDDRSAFRLEPEVVTEEGLKVGQELLANQVESLARSDHFHRCHNAAIHYLNYRPRSEVEVRERLQRRGFDGDTIEVVIAGLKEQGLVNDIDFAQFWRENRDSFSPRSRWLTKLELKQKGVADDIADEVINTIDDDDSAYRAALSKTRSLSQTDYQGFRHRLGGYLKRRGFGYRVINHTIERLWRERGVEPDSILPVHQVGE